MNQQMELFGERVDKYVERKLKTSTLPKSTQTKVANLARNLTHRHSKRFSDYEEISIIKLADEIKDAKRWKPGRLVMVPPRSSEAAFHAICRFREVGGCGRKTTDVLVKWIIEDGILQSD